MATDEASFKLEFKRDIHGYINHHALLWSTSDRVTSGLPDFFILDNGHLVAVEAKFTKELPKKKSSLVLNHEVTPAQKLFLDKTLANKQTALVVIGTPQALVVMTDIKLNYTLEDCLAARRFVKAGSVWQLGGIDDIWK